MGDCTTKLGETRQPVTRVEAAAMRARPFLWRLTLACGHEVMLERKRRPKMRPVHCHVRGCVPESGRMTTQPVPADRRDFVTDEGA